MPRHVIDQPRKRTTSGMKIAFSKIESKQLPRREALILQRRPLETSTGPMLREFARIERGYST
jgi:hypothetical protein